MNPETRFSSQWIVAAQGTGKTELLKYMISQDLQRDCSIVILDSKGDLTSIVRSLALGDRLIVVDPDEPFAINPFDVAKSDHVISQLGYMLGGLLETTITPKQRTFFDTLAESILSFPDPSLPLLWEIISKGPQTYKHQINQLSEDIQSFFWYEWPSYADTAREMQWRLRGIKSKRLLWALLSAPKTRFHIGKAMDEGKVVVIDNTQAKCGPEGCGFIGRLFVAQIWAAGTQRALLPDHKKKPTFVYIDEAHIVIKKDQKISAIIDELRSQKVGLILAHQRTKQIEDANVISALENCAIKMVNSKAEAKYFSDLLDMPEDKLKDLPRGHFATDVRWEGTYIAQVPLAKLPYRNMTAEEQAAHRKRMQDLYGYRPETQKQKAPHTLGEAPSRPATEATGVEYSNIPTRPSTGISKKPGPTEDDDGPTKPASSW